jgi:hypothetical protein
MTTLYTLHNQRGYFLQKKSADKISKASHIWGDAQELSKVFRTTHKDEAINMMFEAGSQDVELRISIKEYPANTKGLPTIPADDLPAPLPKVTAELGNVDVKEPIESHVESDAGNHIENNAENTSEQERAITR